MNIEDWDWNKLLPIDIFYKIVLNDYAGWDKTDKNLPLSIDVILTKKETKSSRELAIEFDDISEGSFYYRDYMNSGLPFADDGEKYHSVFTFQFLSDVIKFKELLADYNITT